MLSSSSQTPALWNSPWPAEDGGPQRLQQGAVWVPAPGSTLRVTHRRTQISTMVVLRKPGEVFLLTHSALRSHLGLPTHAWVHRINSMTLQSERVSPKLAGGPMWPGGFAALGNGQLAVVYGRYAHLLNADCELIASQRLPVAQAYNSFVALPAGVLVTKNLSRDTPAQLSVLDAHSLQPLCAPLVCPEPSVARLSSVGNTVYVAGMQHVYRARWLPDHQRLVWDERWKPDYLQGQPNSHAWDMVMTDDSAWMMDNGHHRYLYTMKKAGVRPTPNALIRVELGDAMRVCRWNISDLAGGSVTNPPLVCPVRKVVMAYDSANSVLRAWRYADDLDAPLVPLWKKSGFGMSSHVMCNPEAGVVWVNDYRGLREHVVALSLECGSELARVATPGRMQGVVFPAPGWNNDVYWVSMDQVVRVFSAG